MPCVNMGLILIFHKISLNHSETQEVRFFSQSQEKGFNENQTQLPKDEDMHFPSLKSKREQLDKPHIYKTLCDFSSGHL